MPIGTIAVKAIDVCNGCIFDNVDSDICLADICDDVIFAMASPPPPVSSSLRERFAGMAMQGMLANPNEDWQPWHPHMATLAVECADALIAELEMTK